MIKNHIQKHEISIILAKLVFVFVCLLFISISSKGQTVEVFTTTGQHTYTVPAGVTQITVEAWGGGGAGGGAVSGRGGGGAGGAYVKSIITVTPNSIMTYYVAPSKTSTYNSSQIANRGNPSWFGSTSTVYAEGGNGGAPASGANGAGGLGSISSSIGTIKNQGGNGFAGTNSNGGTGGGGAGSSGAGGNATATAGGAGTSLYGGNGGGVTGNNSGGLPGTNYGGGGSGGHSNNNSQQEIGGTGAQGIIRITYTVQDPLAATTVTSPSCQGVNPGTGSITITATGGTAPYQFRLGSGTYQSSNTFSSLLAGTYSVTIKDNTGTTLTLNNIVVASQNSTMADLTADIIAAGCNLPNGAISITNIPTALKFNKLNSTHVNLGESLLNNLTEFTIEGWIKIDKSLISGDRTWGLFGQNDAIEFGIMNSTTIQLWTANGGILTVPMSSYPGDNQWHHIAAVGTGAALNIYIDGVIATGNSTAIATPNYGSSAFNSMIGGNIFDPSGNFLDGEILKTGFWNRALTTTEIVNLVNNPFMAYDVSGANGLIAGYNYFEGNGTTLRKTGTASTDGVLINAPQWTEVFTYKWAKSGDPSFISSTKNISSVSAGVYSLTASFTGICPITGSWTISNNGSNVWTGSLSTDWNNISNWSCAIPDLTLDAIIPSGLTKYPVLSNGLTGMCKNIVIQSGASLTVTNNTLQIGGTIQNSGSFDATQGTIEMKGTSAQSIPSSSFSGNAVGNLTINNPGGVTLNGTLYIYGILKATTGGFQTNGFLTLLSTPIQTALIDGTGSGPVLGNITLQRYLPSAYGYKYFSSPFANATVAQYSQEINLSASFASMYYYNENLASTGWKAYTSPIGVLQPGTGYALNFGIAGTPLTVSVTGTVNNGTIGPINLYNNNQPFTKGFNLVGNPYPSPVDWNAAGWTKTNIDNALYYFDAGTTDQYVGTYSTYINGISSNGTASNVIAAQQGFFVHVSDGAYPVHGVLTFSNSVRTNNLNPLFHKNSTAEQQSLIRLSASSKGYLNSDHMVIYLNEFASMSFDKELDALKLKNTDNSVPDLYVLSEDGREVSIKAIPEPIDTYTISLGFSSKINGTVMLKAEDILNAPSGYNIYLKDCYTGLVQDLASNAEYSFTSNTETTHDRFKIILSRENLSHGTMTDENFLAFSENGNVYVNLEVNDLQTIVQMTDLTGRMIVRKELPGEGKRLISAVQGKQVYVVSLFTRNGIFSKKVYVD
ncbi:MAG: LamG-like jellyroll fold domain-containing protein [Chloroflexota bacterium]